MKITNVKAGFGRPGAVILIHQNDHGKIDNDADAEEIYRLLWTELPALTVRRLGELIGKNQPPET